ncbi:MAG TPA: glycosyltransferase [Candidatus Eisenbacteria bacterium]|nr:glycosyltransferase [Candidatus Eisenbacteria bacterium]
MVIPSLNFFLQAALALVGAEWVRRVFWMRGFRKVHPPIVPSDWAGGAAPPVSVIVPARDEEKNIARCLESLFLQSYRGFEIVVVDDRSSDRTPEILERLRAASPVPMRVVRIEKLPPGWTGKNHAMTAGSKAAGGEWLLFTDADTTHTPQSLSTALAVAVAERADFLTLAPETESHSFWEKTVQPLAVGSLALWFNPVKVNDAKSGVTLANGQFILVKKSAYETVGGNESVKDQVVEDVELAKKFRAAGLVVRFLDGTRLYSTRMYSSLAEIRRGWTRIFTHLFEKKTSRILHKVFLYSFFSIFPFVVLFAEGFRAACGSPDAALLASSAAVCALIVAIRFAGNRMVRSDPWFAFLHPLGSLVLVWILLDCVGRIAFNRPSVWRGEHYR